MVLHALLSWLVNHLSARLQVANEDDHNLQQYLCESKAPASYYPDMNSGLDCFFNCSSSSWVASATPSTALSNAASLTFDGLRYPLTFLTNCNAAARISSSVAGISEFRNCLILLHIRYS